MTHEMIALAQRLRLPIVSALQAVESPLRKTMPSRRYEMGHFLSSLVRDYLHFNFYGSDPAA